jgi:hypothetical protein
MSAHLSERVRDVSSNVELPEGEPPEEELVNMTRLRFRISELCVSRETQSEASNEGLNGESIGFQMIVGAD